MITATYYHVLTDTVEKQTLIITLDFRALLTYNAINTNYAAIDHTHDYASTSHTHTTNDIMDLEAYPDNYNSSVTLKWTDTSFSHSYNALLSVCYGNDKFIVTFPNAYNFYYTSDDGISWMQSYLSFTTGSADTQACYGDGKFVLVLNNSKTTAYSTDGLSCTTTSMPDKSYWRSVCYGTPNDSPMFVAITNSYNSNVASYSTDGKTWESITLPSQTQWYSVCWGSDKFAAVGDGGVAAYSTDGKTCDSISGLSTYDLASVCYGSDKFVAVTSGSNKAVCSSEGINWTEMTLPTSDYWKSVCYGDGVLVAVAYSSTSAAFSTGRIIWTESDKINSTDCNSTCYGANKFVTVGTTIESATKVTYTHQISSIPNLEDRLTALETAAATSALSATTERSLVSRDLIDTFYPIGSVYTSVDQTNPSEMFGGSWTQLSIELSWLYFWQRPA